MEAALAMCRAEIDAASRPDEPGHVRGGSIHSLSQAEAALTLAIEVAQRLSEPSKPSS